MVSQTTTTDLHHDVRGTGPLLVLVHGLSESTSSWDPLMDDLAADHRVMRVDLRGHGALPKAGGYRTDEMAADIAQLVGDDVPIVVGHSLGGMVAGAYAAAFPTRGVINNTGPTNSEAKEGKMTTISTERDVATLVNVFTVTPENQQRLVDVLAEAAKTMKTIHGYVSSNLHKSLDGTKVVNYVQWESAGDFQAMLEDPGEAAPHMDEAAGIAEKYEPDLYEVSFVDEATA